MSWYITTCFQKQHLDMCCSFLTTARDDLDEQEQSDRPPIPMKTVSIALGLPYYKYLLLEERLFGLLGVNLALGVQHNRPVQNWLRADSPPHYLDLCFSTLPPRTC